MNKYEPHEPVSRTVYVAQLEKDLVRYRQWVNDLQAGMCISCVYCGYQYGPDPGTPVAMADVLKAHIEVCPEHPMSRLKEALTAYKKALADEKDIEDDPHGRNMLVPNWAMKAAALFDSIMASSGVEL